MQIYVNFRTRADSYNLTFNKFKLLIRKIFCRGHNIALKTWLAAWSSLKTTTPEMQHTGCE